MNIQTIISTLSHIVPFWSSTLVQYSGIGNEYSMLITLILQNMIEYFKHFVTELSIYIIFATVIILIIAIQNKWLDINMFMTNQKTIILIGNEKDNIISYTDKLCAVSQCLVEEYNFSNLLLGKTSTHILMLGNIKQFKINNDLFLNISRSDIEVIYTFTSFNYDILKFINDANNKYCNNDLNESVILYGIENENTYDYSIVLLSIIFTVINKYSWKNTIIKSKKINEKKNELHHIKVIDKTQLLQDSCSQYITDEITLSVSRSGNVAKYEIKSRLSLHNFINECKLYYECKSKQSDYKYVFTLEASESFRYGKYAYMYPQSILALCHNLIQNGHGHYKLIQNFSLGSNQYMDIIDVKDNEKTFIIDDVKNLQFDDIILSINKFQLLETDSTLVSYILESNTIDLKKYIDNLLFQYELFNGQLNCEKLFHFKFKCFDDNKPTFTSEIIYDRKPILCESFDNIITEHNDLLLSDLKRLKDDEHYLKFGLKKKKSYVFYGPYGTGKTSMVSAIAMKDKRHIVSIHITSQMTNEQFCHIMSVTEIHGIKLPRNKRIILIEEIDYALEKMETKVPESSEKTIVINTSASDNNDKSSSNNSSDDKLSYETLLTELDGVHAYDGDIFITTTNNIEKLNPALCRSMRLTPLKFDLKSGSQIKEFIMRYFPTFDLNCDEIKLSSAQLTLICEKLYDMSILQKTNDEMFYEKIMGEMKCFMKK